MGAPSAGERAPRGTAGRVLPARSTLRYFCSRGAGALFLPPGPEPAGALSTSRTSLVRHGLRTRLNAGRRKPSEGRAARSPPPAHPLGAGGCGHALFPWDGAKGCAFLTRCCGTGTGPGLVRGRGGRGAPGAGQPLSAVAHCEDGLTCARDVPSLPSPCRQLPSSGDKQPNRR